MNTLQMHIDQGNRCFRNKAFDQAEAAFIQACELAEKLLHQWLEAEEVVAAVTSSYFNLADCLKCQGRYQLAQEVLDKLDSLLQAELGKNSVNAKRQALLMKGRSASQMELRQIEKFVQTSSYTSFYSMSAAQ